MRSRHHWFLAAAMVLLAAWHPAAQKADPPARPDLVREPYSEADVAFMAGMIPHHAQAVLIAGWAALARRAAGRRASSASASSSASATRSSSMRNWLRDRGQAVPAADATHHRMKMNGVEHDMLMPGMLTAEELAALDKARGPEWDRLFLDGDDQAPRGRAEDGRRAVRVVRRARRTTTCSSSRRTSTPTRRPKSNACRRCSLEAEIDEHEKRT